MHYIDFKLHWRENDKTLFLQTNQLLTLLLDKTSVVNANAHATTTTTTTTSRQADTSAKGAVFYATYRATIDSYLVTVAKEFVPLLLKQTSDDASIVGSVLIGLLDHVSRDRQLRKK